MVWGPNGDDPLYSFEICPCCGTEFGYEDCTLKATRINRARWLEKGAPWFEVEKRPDDWDVNEQLSKIPAELL
ncbi:hypothetical protein DV096_12105 [Bradymonadaceae bacterium TMQ3]|uniref:Threonine synthase n=1 Tax=Lujinxingia sediminis TaxID=2480984 RepID=A0ABY0CR51_9DELT|nr:hypothetical protein DV096_12105 [Bradymonadaceae bacterium TMQ3]RVU42838.1 hypothetical protein EA187_15020 [Lujinxingia sediminis]TXC75553.1 hypothetical protein FRC91_11665 [Bradymonadales bacterium TMQ1]